MWLNNKRGSTLVWILIIIVLIAIGIGIYFLLTGDSSVANESSSNNAGTNVGSSIPQPPALPRNSIVDSEGNLIPQPPALPS